MSEIDISTNTWKATETWLTGKRATLIRRLIDTRHSLEDITFIQGQISLIEDLLRYARPNETKMTQNPDRYSY